MARNLLGWDGGSRAENFCTVRSNMHYPNRVLLIARQDARAQLGRAVLRPLTSLAVAVLLSACLGDADAPADAVDLAASTEQQALTCELPILTRPGSTMTSPGDPRAGLCQGPGEYRGYPSASELSWIGSCR
jgi:hypothetical protein